MFRRFSEVIKPSYRLLKSKIKKVVNKMEKSELYTKLETMVEMTSSKHMLDSIVRALSSDELEDNLRFIDRVEEFNMFD